MKPSLSLVFGLVAAVLAARAHTQTCGLTGDVNANGAGIGSNPSGAWTAPGGQQAKGLVKCGSYWYFRATTCAEGGELWRTDGTAAGTTMVKDLNPGAAGSEPTWLTCCKSGSTETLFFRATGVGTGVELYKSDGTAAGTVLVKDIETGAGNSTPVYLQCIGGKVYFSANTSASGRELWCSHHAKRQVPGSPPSLENCPLD